MKQVGIRALKQNASAVVAAAAAGEIFVITDRGRAVAQMGPVPTSRLAGLLAAGSARPPRRSLGSLGLPPRRRVGQRPLSETLAAMRSEERY